MRPWGFARGEIFIVTRKRQTAAFEWRTVKQPPSKQSVHIEEKRPNPESIQWDRGLGVSAFREEIGN